MEPGRSPAQLIADSEGLLLDFDGPVCDVYAGSDPARIAREVAATFNLHIDTNDPLDLITHAIATGGPVDEIHQALAETEIEAVETARATPGARQLVESYHGPIGIVSNNAKPAIARWLTEAGLAPLVRAVVGRDPRRMKPDPWPLASAADCIARPIRRCVFIGDSMTDIVAADRAGAPVVALADRAHKRQLFQDLGCTDIVETMHELHRQ